MPHLPKTSPITLRSPQQTSSGATIWSPGSRPCTKAVTTASPEEKQMACLPPSSEARHSSSAWRLGCPRASSCTRGDNRPRDCVRRWWKGGWAASPLRWQGRYGGPHGPPGFQSSSLTSVASAGLSAAVESDHHRHQQQKDARYVGIRRIKLHGRYTAADGVPYLPAKLGRDREEYAPETEYGQRTHHNDHSIIRFGTPDGCGCGAELVPISWINRGLEACRGICRVRNRAPAGSATTACGAVLWS